MNFLGSSGGGQRRKLLGGISDVNVVIELLMAAFGAIALVLTLLAAGATFALGYPLLGAVHVFIHLATAVIVPTFFGRNALDTDFALQLWHAPQRVMAMLITTLVFPLFGLVLLVMFDSPSLETFGVSAICGGGCASWIVIHRNMRSARLGEMKGRSTKH